MATENRVINYTIKVNSKELTKHLSKIQKLTEDLISNSFKSVKEIENLAASVKNDLVDNLSIVERMYTSIESKTNSMRNSFKQFSKDFANISIEEINFNSTLNSFNNIIQRIDWYIDKVEESIQKTKQLFGNYNQSVKGNGQLGLNSNMSISNSTQGSINPNFIKKANDETGKFNDTLGDFGKIVDTSIGVFSLFSDLAGAASILFEGTAVASGLASAGIATLAIGALAGLTYALIKNNSYSNEAIALNDKHKTSIDNINDALKEGKNLSNNSYQSSLNSLYLPKNYAADIKKMIDDQGNLIGNKEDLIDSINAFNSSMGYSLLYYDEEANKLKSIDGEVENVSKSLDDLFTKKRGESYISSYIGNYQQQMQALDQLKIFEKEKKDMLNEIKEKYAKDGIDMKAFVEYYYTANDDEYTRMVELKKMGVDSNLLNNSKFLEDLGDFKSLTTDLEALNDQTDRLELSTGKFQDFYKAYANNDTYAVDGFLDGANMLEDLDNLDLLIEKIAFAKQNLEATKIEAKNGTMTDEDVQSSQEILDGLYEEFKLKTSFNFDDVIEQATLSGELYGTTYTEQIKGAIDSMNEDMVTDTETSVGQVLGAITTLVSTYIPPKIVIPVTYEIMGGGISSLFYSGLPKSSYDDSQENPQPIISTMNPKTGLQSILAIQSKIGKSIHIKIPEVASTNYSELNTSVVQNLSFNQPIQKPSDVSRALQKAARDLRKVK
ncbi:MAG: hypothetical protein RR734_02215 [Bacilli bacterium]|uniref:hypothetical protein n=1 Tax=Anaerorhabdus sp. TaxID=1872524 RepID=UPI002FCC93C9